MVLNNVTKFHRILIETIHVVSNDEFSQTKDNNSLKHVAI